MKTYKPISYLAIGASILLASCGDRQNKKQIDYEASKPQITNSCYLAIDKKDTALLELHLAKNKMVTGELTFNYFNHDDYKGNFEGNFLGDTLFVMYVFKNGTQASHTNPLAFLKKNDSLLLGVGVVKTYLGRSYLDKAHPIDFDKGRFKFVRTKCSLQ